MKPSWFSTKDSRKARVHRNKPTLNDRKYLIWMSLDDVWISGVEVSGQGRRGQLVAEKAKGLLALLLDRNLVQ